MTHTKGRAATLTNHTYTQPAEETMTKAHQENKQPGGLYGEQGLYRVVEARLGWSPRS